VWVIRFYNFTDTFYGNSTHPFCQLFAIRLQPKKFCICKFTKKWFTQGYGENNMLINGSSAARRPKVGGGGGGASKLSAVTARRDRRRALRSGTILINNKAILHIIITSYHLPVCMWLDSTQPHSDCRKSKSDTKGIDPGNNFRFISATEDFVWNRLQ